MHLLHPFFSRKPSLALKCKSSKAVPTLKVGMFGRRCPAHVLADLQQMIEGFLVIGQQHSIA